MEAVKDKINWKKAKAKSSIFHKKSKPQRHRLSKTKEKKIGATKQNPWGSKQGKKKNKTEEGKLQHSNTNPAAPL